MAQAPANVGHEEVAAAMNEAQAQPPVAEPVAPASPLQDDNVSFESFLRSSLCNFSARGRPSAGLFYFQLVSKIGGNSLCLSLLS